MPKEGLSLREEQFVDLLSANNWIVWKAGVEAGFSENYARHRLPARMLSNVALKQAIEAKKAEIQAKTDYNRSQAEYEYEQVRTLAITKKDLAAANQAIKGKARLYGLDLDKHVGEGYEGHKPPPAEALATSKAKAEQITAQNSSKTAQDCAGEEITQEPIPNDQVN